MIKQQIQNNQANPKRVPEALKQKTRQSKQDSFKTEKI